MKRRNKKLTLLDLIGLSLSSIFLLDSFALSAAIGWQGIIFWISLGILFFIPYCLITSELATSYVDGGIYTWVKKPFGARWASRMNWFYWLNVSLWTASVYLVFSGFISESFINPFIDGNFDIRYEVLIACAIGIAVGFACLLDIKTIKYFTNISAILKVVIFLFMIASLIVWLSKGNGISTPLDHQDYGIVPSWSKGIIFFPAIINTLTGIETSSNYVTEIDNPKKDIPVAILITGVITIVGYIFALIIMNIILESPFDETTGLIQMFSTTMPQWLSMIISLLMMFTLFGDCVTWNSSANFGISEAADDKQFPSWFSKHLKKTNAPFGATIISTFVSIVILLAAEIVATSGDIKELFWLLYSLGSIISLLPYIFIFSGFLRLRYIDPDHERSFKVKGPNWFLWILSILPIFVIIISIIVFIFGEVMTGQKEFTWQEAGSDIFFLLLAVGISFIICEILMIIQKYLNKKNKIKN